MMTIRNLIAIGSRSSGRSEAIMADGRPFQRRTSVKNAELIRALAADLTPLPPGKTRHEMLIGLGFGSAASLLLLLAVYGVQPDLDTIAHGGPLLMKAWYGLSLAAIAGSMLMPMLRPAAPVPGQARVLWHDHRDAGGPGRMADGCNEFRRRTPMAWIELATVCAADRGAVGAGIHRRSMGNPPTGPAAFAGDRRLGRRRIRRRGSDGLRARL